MDENTTDQTGAAPADDAATPAADAPAPEAEASTEAEGEQPAA